PVIVKPTDTIIKVAAKDKVVYSKDGDNIVKEVTTYIVNPTNGNITGHTTKETFKENGLKDKVEVETIPSPVKYEKDTSREKGQDNITVPGKAGSKTTTTTYTLNPNSGEAIAHVGEPVIVNPTTTIVKVAAKDKVVTSKDGNNIVKTATSYTVNPDNGNIIEHTTKETFKENGLKDKVEVETIPSPVKYEKDASRDRGQDNITVPGKDGSKTTTTTYTVNPDNGEVTPNEGNPVIVNPTETIVKVAAKDKVVETPIEPTVVYEKDDTRDFGTPDERTEGEKGKAVTTTTYDVDPKDGHITEHVDNPVVTPAGKTIVKVGAKTKVERSKDDQGREVINTTTYEVDSKTGKVTPTTVTTYGTRKEATIEKKVVPSPVRYEKDNTKEEGTETITVKGEDGEDTITTTYTVDPKTGKITPIVGQPVRTKEPTNTIVKVPAKDKVVETPIEPEVEYVKDVEKDFGTPDERTEGEKGKTVTTTTYDVDSKDGHITEHLGNPVVTPAGKTIVKVGAKPKAEHSKDPEGRDVIDTTTYEVDSKTGKIIPTTVRTYGKTKEPTVELEQDPKTGEVTVTPKKPDGSTYPPGTTVEIPVKGDKPITVTIGEDGKGKVPNSELPEGKVPGTGKITEPGKPAVEVPVENPAKVTAENGELSGPITLPEVTIEVRWIDEDGNVLKPSLKTGSEKDSEHGSIPGYEFVRTVIAENEPVMIHIFSKVSGTPTPVTPETNGGSGHDTPAPTTLTPVAPVTTDTNGNSGHDTPELTTPTPIPVGPVIPDVNGNSGHDTPTPTTPIPDSVTPSANHENTKDAIDNGVKSKDSQNVLPNTGTESNATLAFLGLLGMLSGIGFVFGKKKED
ncbi:G5 domain-containing protein, partial [Streptococcus mitis]